jgi:hypothetical protein
MKTPRIPFCAIARSLAIAAAIGTAAATVAFPAAAAHPGAGHVAGGGGWHGGTGGWHGGTCGWHGSPGRYYGGWGHRGYWPGAFWGGIGLGLGIGAVAYYGPYYGGYYVPYYDGYYYDAPVVVTPAYGSGNAASRTGQPVPQTASAPEPIFYPKTGQSAETTESDRRDCNRWATTQRGAMSDATIFQRATYACMEGRGYTVK